MAPLILTSAIDGREWSASGSEGFNAGDKARGT